jgi:fructose-bisphosphate aldolase, class II
MPLVPFNELMDKARQGRYAVGYFETWSLESLSAVADAAEATRSPVILGFGGLFWPSAACPTKAHLSAYAGMGLAACERLSVPACLIFNESPHLDWVFEAIDLGFGVVMFADDGLAPDDEAAKVAQTVQRAHGANVAVEGEVAAPPGLHGDLTGEPADRRATDPDTARAFVERTGVDALAVNVGQVHLHGRSQVRLDLDRVPALCEAVDVPLVLHGASSIHRPDLHEAVRLGVRKVNVGSVLKSTYFDALRTACAGVGEGYNPYEVIGSGLDCDVLAAGGMAMQKVTEALMHLFGSAGQA